jgi:hypothetical protein
MVMVAVIVIPHTQRENTNATPRSEKYEHIGKMHALLFARKN